MRSSILTRLLASGGCGCGCGGRVWRSKRSGCGSVLGGRRLISTASKVGTWQSQSPPWLMLPPGRGSNGDIMFNFYSVAGERELSFGGGFPLEAGDRFVGSSHGWLALYNDRTKCLFLSNPVSGRRINLPPPPSDCIHTVSRVVLSCSPDNDNDECRAVMSFVPKVIDVDDPLVIDVDPSKRLTDKQHAAKQFARHLPSMSLGPAERLAFCRANAGANWTPVTEIHKSYGDLVYSRKRKYLFCLTTDYNEELEKRDVLYSRGWIPNLSDVEVWDLSDPECPRIERRLSLTELPRLVHSSGLSERRYLVYSEELDQLYLIRRHMIERVQVRGHNTGKIVKDIYFDNRGGWDNSYPYKTVGFDIHAIDDKDGKLLVDEKEVSLDNVAIFIGINHGLMMEAAADQYQLNSNSIYFTDDTIHTPPNVRDDDKCNRYWRLFVRHKWDSKWAYSSSVYGGHDIGIFDCKNKTISPCFYPIDPPSLKRIDPPPLWFTPHLNIT